MNQLVKKIQLFMARDGVSGNFQEAQEPVQINVIEHRRFRDFRDDKGRVLVSLQLRELWEIRQILIQLLKEFKILHSLLHC